MQNDFINQVRKLAEDVCVREGCTLYDLEFLGGAVGRTLRVYIDKEGESGVSVEDCSNVSRGLNLLLDVEDVIPGGQYHLEVSSPGLERVLKLPWHFQRAQGKNISLKSFAALLDFNPDIPELGKARQLQGVLLNADVEAVTVSAKIGGAERAIKVPLETITKAQLIFDFENLAQPKKGAGAPNKKR